MNADICDVKNCGKIAYEEVMIRKNYWLGEKIVKMDVCYEHEKELLKAIGFDDDWAVKRYEKNQWKKRD